MKLTNDHVHRFVDEIHLVLMETVREAARRSVMSDASGSTVTDARAAQQLDFLRLKGFENAVVLAASQALEEWRAEAHKVAEAMVQMECDYVTPSFFRDLERRWQEEAAAGLSQDGPGPDGGHMDRLDALATGQVSVDAEGDDSDNESTAETGTSPQAPGALARANTGSPPAARAMQQRADMKAGWLEKRAGDSSSLSSLPVDSWRWQKRWFVLAMELGLLYYFPSPDDVNRKQPKVAINLAECIVEDFQPEGAGMPTRRSTQRLDNNAGSVSLLIRISHRNPNMPLVKNHHQMILRAADAADKYEWLARLRNGTQPGAGVGKGPPISATSSQYLSPQNSGAVAPRQQQPLRGQQAQTDAEGRGLFGRTLNKVTDQFAKFTGLGNSKLGDVMAAGSIEDLDAYYEKLGMFCGLYARAVYDRMAKTVPKAIILCQVIRSRDRLLDQLFNYLSSLSPKEVEFMLQEDPVVARRRAAAQQAGKDLHDAQEEVKRLQERRAEMGPAAAKKDSEEVSVRALLLAGAYPLVPKDRVPPGIEPGALYGEHTPMTLTAGSEAKKQLGAPLGAKAEGEKAAKAENGTAAPASAGAGVASPAGSVSGAAPKPRRQPPPPPPKH